MTIFCKICGYRMQSSEPPAEAQKDVLKQMSTHIGVHQPQAESLAVLLRTSFALLNTYLLLKKYVRIPDTEKELLDTFDENEGLLIDLFSIEQPVETKPQN